MNSPILKLTVPEIEQGNRLDIFCAHKVEGYSRNHFTKLATAGHITVNGKPAKPSHKVKTGELVVIEMASPPPIEAEPENIPLEIIFEDDYLLVVNKPADMVCHPAAGNYAGTLINALLYHFSHLKDFSDKIRPGLVHRLDKDTSGLLVVAKDEKTLALLQTMMLKRAIERRYTALVWGKMPQKEGTIDLPLGRSPADRKIMKVFGAKNRASITHFKVVKSYPIAELLEINLQTGRTHQIRVHLSYYGNPVVGDPTYGGRSKAVKRFQSREKQLALSLLRVLSRQALHATTLSFTHPITQKPMQFASELPEDFKRAMEVLEGEGGNS
jgi:23S rRNA pseudouridine1911/1915/1917 synthase